MENKFFTYWTISKMVFLRINMFSANKREKRYFVILKKNNYV